MRKILPKYNSYSNRIDLADKVRDAGGNYHLERDIRNGKCLSDYDASRAERFLRDSDMMKGFDYISKNCHCDSDEY